MLPSGGAGTYPCAGRSPALSRLVQGLRFEIEAPDELSRDIVRGQVERILELLIPEEAQTEKLTSKTPPCLDILPGILEEARDSSFGLEQAAQLAGTTAPHLARACRREFDLTFGELLRRVRVRQAAALIADAVPLSDVATEAGFHDQSHLTRVFRALTGETPGAFRRRLRADRDRGAGFDLRLWA